MSDKDFARNRAKTDANLQLERDSADDELAKRVAAEEKEADEVLRVARLRADRLLEAARASADSRSPLGEQAEAAVALLLEQRSAEDRAVALERQNADDLLSNERRQRRLHLSAQLVLERQATDLALQLERTSADRAVSSRDEFLAQASHDLRALMAAQKLYLSLLAKAIEPITHDQVASCVAALVKIEAQMDRLVSDLVDMVAIDAGKLSVTLGTHSAAELLSTAVAVFDPLATEREQTLSLAPAAEDVLVSADAARAVQVLGNLLSNAIKFTPRNGKVRAGFDATEHEVVFFVADTGRGVPPPQRERIFQPFVGSSSARGGLGLGLFIAARVVEAHGGRIWLEDNSGHGSVFRFTLKRAS